MDVATAGDLTRTLDASPDTARPRTFWRDAEFELIAERDCERRGVRRVQKNRLLNVRRTGAVLRKRDAAGGNGTASTAQLARDLYADVADAWDTGDYLRAYDLARDKRASIVRWLGVLRELGVIEYETLPGKGFRWRFCAVPQEVAILAESRGCSSVGSSDSRRSARRPLRASQDPAKRVRRYCPRAGRGAVYEPPRQARRFFSPPEFETPGAGEGVGPLKGTSPPSPARTTRADARARGPVDTEAATAAGAVAALRRRWEKEDGVDALRRACPADQLAAFDGLRLELLNGDEGVDRIRQAAKDGAPWTAFALALWLAFCRGREPRLSREAQAQLERSANQLERLWGRDALVDQLVGWFETSADEAKTLRLFVVMLKHAGRQARRHRRGAPRPRPWRSRGELL